MLSPGHPHVGGVREGPVDGGVLGSELDPGERGWTVARQRVDPAKEAGASPHRNVLRRCPAARAASSELARLAPGEHRILVVDDNSPDGTGAIADALAAEITEIEVLHRQAKAGLGQAYKAGFARALAGGAELAIEMDADFSHDPRYLADLLHAAGTADLVLGSRYVSGG